jgi:hypothetical protein
VGTNGIGKSTALKILAGKLKPNLGRFTVRRLQRRRVDALSRPPAPQNPPDWQEILAYFRGSELQNYFTKLLEEDVKAVIKPQYVDHIPKAVRGNVGEVLEQKDQRGVKDMLLRELDLEQVRCCWGVLLRGVFVVVVWCGCCWCCVVVVLCCVLRVVVVVVGWVGVLVAGVPACCCCAPAVGNNSGLPFDLPDEIKNTHNKQKPPSLNKKTPST